MYVVIMIEPAVKEENLSIGEQINEAFGPFNDEEEAENWTLNIDKLIPNREWLIIPLSGTNLIDNDRKPTR